MLRDTACKGFGKYSRFAWLGWAISPRWRNTRLIVESDGRDLLSDHFAQLALDRTSADQTNFLFDQTPPRLNNQLP